MNLPQQHGNTPRQMLRLKDVVKLCGLRVRTRNSS